VSNPIQFNISIAAFQGNGKSWRFLRKYSEGDDDML
jgi:hypothetical protein